MGQARVSQFVIEVLEPYVAPDPATPTGAGVSQYVVEVLAASPGKARVSQFVIEVLIAEGNTARAAPSKTRSFGHAG